MVNLVQLPAGKQGKVISIEGGTGLKNKLFNLGIREGVMIKKITGIFSHGPVVIKISQTEIALGRGMASKIFVEPV